MTNILLVITSVAHVKELRRVADFLKRSGCLTPLFFSHIGVNYLNLGTYCRDENITLYDHEGVRTVGPASEAFGRLETPSDGPDAADPPVMPSGARSLVGATLAGDRVARAAADLKAVLADRFRAEPRAPALDLVVSEIAALHAVSEVVDHAIGELTARVVERLGFAPAPADFVPIATELSALRAIERIVEHVLQVEAIDLVVICEDNVEVASAIWIKTGHRLGVPTVVLPFTVATYQEAAETYFDDAGFHVDAHPLNRQAALHFPKWVMSYERPVAPSSRGSSDGPVESQTLLRLPAARLLAREILDVSPPLPWTLNSGDADIIAVESLAMHDHYRSCGLPEQQLVLTGSLADDAMENGLRNRAMERAALLAEHGIAGDPRILLCAFPPDQHPTERPGCEFTDYESLVRYWAETLCKASGWQIVIRPHPNSVPSTLAALKDYPIAVSSRPTEELIPLCDLFVASVSATIRWAIACDRPVVNYDVYQYGYTDYRNAPGVFTVNRRDDFEEIVARLTGNPLRRKIAALRQRTVAHNWGMLDGHSGARLLSLFSRLIAGTAGRGARSSGSSG